jgi:hypothetical protein
MPLAISICCIHILKMVGRSTSSVSQISATPCLVPYQRETISVPVQPFLSPPFLFMQISYDNTVSARLL